MRQSTVPLSHLIGYHGGEGQPEDTHMLPCTAPTTGQSNTWHAHSCSGPGQPASPTWSRSRHKHPARDGCSLRWTTPLSRACSTCSPGGPVRTTRQDRRTVIVELKAATAMALAVWDSVCDNEHRRHARRSVEECATLARRCSMHENLQLPSAPAHRRPGTSAAPCSAPIGNPRAIRDIPTSFRHLKPPQAVCSSPRSAPRRYHARALHPSRMAASLTAWQPATWPCPALGAHGCAGRRRRRWVEGARFSPRSLVLCRSVRYRVRPRAGLLPSNSTTLTRPPWLPHDHRRHRIQNARDGFSS